MKEFNIIDLVTSDKYWECATTKTTDKSNPNVEHYGYELVFSINTDELKEKLLLKSNIPIEVVDGIFGSINPTITNITNLPMGSKELSLGKYMGDEFYKIIIPNDTIFRNYDYKKYFEVLKNKICDMAYRQAQAAFETFNRPKNIFISQPLCCKTESSINKDGDRILRYLKLVIGDTPIKIIQQNHHVPLGNELSYLSESIELMKNADIIVFARDWESSSECRVHRMIASEYQLRYIIEPDKL